MESILMAVPVGTTKDLDALVVAAFDAKNPSSEVMHHVSWWGKSHRREFFWDLDGALKTKCPETLRQTADTEITAPKPDELELPEFFRPDTLRQIRGWLLNSTLEWLVHST